jgi:hypothetical protein
MLSCVNDRVLYANKNIELCMLITLTTSVFSIFIAELAAIVFI